MLPAFDEKVITTGSGFGLLAPLTDKDAKTADSSKVTNDDCLIFDLTHNASHQWPLHSRSEWDGPTACACYEVLSRFFS